MIGPPPKQNDGPTGFVQVCGAGY